MASKKETSVESEMIHEVSKRQWIVATGKAAKVTLIEKYGLDPTSEFIRNYIEEIKGSPDDYFHLRKKANLIIASEFQERVRKVIKNKGIKPQEAAKMVRSDLKRYYEEIEGDAENNYSYLDDIVRGVR